MFIGCTAQSEAIKSGYWFKSCVFMGESMYRCENKEVICYRFYPMASGVGLSCNWKKK